VDVRPCLAGPHPPVANGSAFAIETGSDFVIGPME
jgi:hypothetical protein